MSLSHPPEPWSAIRYENVAYRSETDVSIEHSADGTVIEQIDATTANRICACLNALAGIPTEAVSDQNFKTLLHTLAQYAILDDRIGQEQTGLVLGSLLRRRFADANHAEKTA